MPEVKTQTGGKPLQGVRILDFSRVLAGPYCTALLADLGAEVIKVETARGDDYRHVGPFKDDESLLFQAVNRGKKSIVLDLKNPQDLETARRLAATVDAVVENFRPGVMDRLGLGYAALHEINPALVYVSVSGFGQTGPWSQQPAYDVTVQAMSGIMSITGDPEGSPTMVGEAIGDVAGGVFAAMGLLAALLERTRTGRGRHVDVALLDSLLAMMPTLASRTLLGGETPMRTGNRHALSSPFGTYKARDGHFAVAVLSPRLFEQFCGVLGRPDLLDDPRFKSDAERRRHEPALAEAIEGWAATKTAAEAVESLSAGGIPAALLATIKEAWNSPHAADRRLFGDADHPRLGPIKMPEQPIHFSGVERGGLAPAPALDQHRDEILAHLTSPKKTEAPQ